MTTEETEEPKYSLWKAPHTTYMLDQFRAFENFNGKKGWNPNADTKTRREIYSNLIANKSGDTIFHRKDVGIKKFLTHYSLKRAMLAVAKNKERPENRRVPQDRQTESDDDDSGGIGNEGHPRPNSSYQNEENG